MLKRNAKAWDSYYSHSLVLRRIIYFGVSSHLVGLVVLVSMLSATNTHWEMMFL